MTSSPATPLGRFIARVFLTLFMAPFFAGGWFFAFGAGSPDGAFGAVFTAFGLAFMGLAVFVVGAAWFGNVFRAPATTNNNPATPDAPGSPSRGAPNPKAPKPGGQITCSYCGRVRANAGAPCESCGGA